MNWKSIQTTFYLMTALLFILIFGFGIFSDGMFADGIFYATVANNYAQGVGTFWDMYSGNTPESVFHDQPPVAIFLQAQFFKIFGDTIYTERIYSFLFCLLNLFLIKILWQEITNKTNKFYWLPILLYIVIPLTAFTYRHNLIEVTMSAFDMAAVILLLIGCKRDNIIYLFAGSICILLASLSKGMQGLFPVITPFAYWLVMRRESFSKLFVRTLITVSIPVVTFIYFYITPEINESITKYFEKRIVGTFAHLQDTKKSHFYLFIKLWFELLASIALVGIGWMLSRKKMIHYQVDVKSVIFLFIIGFSGSLPLMVTLEQRAFYLTTTLPYFVIGIGLFAIPFAQTIIASVFNRNYRITNYVLGSLIVIFSIAVFMQSSKPKRDHDLLSDLYTIREHIPKRTAVSTTPEVSMNWAYKNYFMRYCYINLDADDTHSFYLLEGVDATLNKPGYTKLELPLKKFSVYKAIGDF